MLPSLISRKLWDRTPCKLPLAFVYHGLKSTDYKRNLNLAKYDASVGRKSKIDYIPPVFDVFVSSACNLRCPTCLFRLKDNEVFSKANMINLAVLTELIDRYSGVITTVWLSGGEPLLHPKFDLIVKMLKDRKLAVMLSTNGLLVEEHINSLEAVDFINVSVDGYDYESFEKYRAGTSYQFDKIVRGMSYMREWEIQFANSFVVSQENVSEIYEMLGFATKVSASSVYFHNINPHGSNEYRPLVKTSNTIGIMNDIMARIDYPFDITLPVIYDVESPEFHKAKCTQPWGGCYFDGKGDIAYCCHLRHDSSIGNVCNGYDFNSPMMVEFRQRMIESDYSEDCLYCSRRFAGKEYARFNARTRRWR